MDRSLFSTALLAVVILLFASSGSAQVAPSATRSSGALQLGAQFSWGNSDYGSKSIEGYGFYATYHVAHNFRIEGDFRQLDSHGKLPFYERTFEMGPEYSFRMGPFRPYLKALYGRGVFNFPPAANDIGAGSVANLAYNLFTPGGGVEYRFQKPFSVRLDYEHQDWLGFPPHGLSPQVVSIGVAYRFH